MVHHHDGLVYRHSSSTEAIIQRTIEGIQKLLNPQYGNTTLEEEQATAIKINPAIKKHFEIKTKILQDSPRDADKLMEILKAKECEYEKAHDSEDIERLVTEIDTLKFVLQLVRRKLRTNDGSPHHILLITCIPLFLMIPI